MSAVEIPSASPKRRASPPPPPPLTQSTQHTSAAPAPTKAPSPTPPAPSASFTSTISTLTSVPPSTQSSSRRVIKAGLQAVTNSDSGTDSSNDDDDDDDLADMSILLPARKRLKMTPPTGVGADHAIDVPDTVVNVKTGGKRKCVRLLDQGGNSNTPRTCLSTPPRTMDYKHSLAHMVREQKKRAQLDARVERAEAAVAAAEKERQDRIAAEGGKDVESRGLAMTDDAEGGERMMQAMARTEAWRDETRFHFFTDPGVRVTDEPFPIAALPDAPWVGLLRDDRARRQACLTGFVADVAAKGVLPGKVVRWFIHQLVHESREELCEAYLGIIEGDAASGRSTAGEVADLRELFRITSIGQARLAQHDTGASTPALRGPRPAKDLPPGLRHAIRAVQLTNPSPSSFTDLALLNIDHHVTKTIHLRLAIAGAIGSLLEESTNDSAYMASIVAHAIQCLDGLTRLLQCRFITSLPATTTTAREVRRKLALWCVTKWDKHKKQKEKEELNCAHPIWAKRILKTLQNDPDFLISESTNYALLHSLTEVLDIAIDAGFTSSTTPPPSKLSLQSDSALPPVSAALAPSTPSTRCAPSNANGEIEVSFNRQIDAITTALRSLAARIKDAGATHLARTECKAAIERVVIRLECCVRTKLKVRRGVFAGGREREREKGAMEGFVRHLGKGDLDAVGEGVNVIDEGKLAGEGEEVVAAEDDDVDARPSRVFHAGDDGSAGVVEGAAPYEGDVPNDMANETVTGQVRVQSPKASGSQLDDDVRL
ncbi:hypothetical protein BAUCODRAFT_124064 [Baudoinia panamericana UAMH 10762]|uniref:Uncharacterized protein n=1 Tax=Baudoinia panamericana (strain UAMH 10762) TaxID=717646 RepID=M2MSF5_BAUPA|nr:uncharacterized protein BAUCODRAFT_124064 [Baudoinia panamericana UAMH 10762]EMC94438.1 hypothetical protein BAUCODRAFT_124064 [Baudoinia panamericana UAMH 10762]